MASFSHEAGALRDMQASGQGRSGGEEARQVGRQRLGLVMVQHVGGLVDGFEAEIRHQGHALQELLAAEFAVKEHEIQRLGAFDEQDGASDARQEGVDLLDAVE